MFCGEHLSPKVTERLSSKLFPCGCLMLPFTMKTDQVKNREALREYDNNVWMQKVLSTDTVSGCEHSAPKVSHTKCDQKIFWALFLTMLREQKNKFPGRQNFLFRTFVTQSTKNILPIQNPISSGQQLSPKSVWAESHKNGQTNVIKNFGHFS